MQTTMTTKDKKLNFIISFIVLFITWGGMLRRSFNADTMYHMVSDGSDMWNNIRDGRFMSALVYFVLDLFGLDTTTHTGVTALVSIVVLAAAAVLFQYLLSLYFHAESLVDRIVMLVISLLPFVNVLFSEVFMFGECTFGFAMTYFLALLACVLFAKGKYVTAFICMILSTMFYQVGSVFAVMILSAFIFIKYQEELNWKAVKEELLCIVVTVLPGGINLLTSKLLESFSDIGKYNKSVDMTNLRDKIGYIFDINIRMLKNNLGILPDFYIPAIFLGIAIIIILVRMIKAKKYMSIVYLVLLFIVENLSLYGMSLLQSTPALYPRMVFPFYAMTGMFVYIAYKELDIKWSMRYFYLIAVFFIFQIWFINLIVIDHYTSNTLDEVYIKMVCDKVQEYEEETGTQVTKIAIERDVDSHLYYDQISLHADQINERTMGLVNLSLLEVFGGREFTKVSMPDDIYATYFEGKDWEYLDLSEQLLFVDDTAYWIIF